MHLNDFPNDFKYNPAVVIGTLRHQERADRFARCAKLSDLDDLRQAIDGPPEYSSTRYALGMVILANQACYAEMPHAPLTPEPMDLGSCNSALVYGTVDSINAIRICRAPYDRAAILRKAMAKYAGPIILTRFDTTDAAVWARLNAREVRLNRFRYGDDQLLFRVAICMVRLQPGASVDLMQSTDVTEQFRLEDKIVDGSRECVGGARKIALDPVLFRDYITDAVYRWVVAARNVSSLIPQNEDAVAKNS